MAGQSVQLDNHHHDPLCSPSRAALLTGRYATRSGVWHVIHGRHLLDPSATTMADVFSANGYRTGMFGKWHLGDNYPFSPQYRGFDEVVCHRGGGVGELPDFWGNNYLDDTYFRNGQPEQFTGYCTDVFFDEAMAFIDVHSSQPFFVYLATNAMHSPFIVPDQYSRPYLDQGVPQPRANFYGMIANFDENMGRLFDLLTRCGLNENTIVIFTADHGTAAGYDVTTGEGYNAGMRGRKGDVYDGGHRVNFFMRWSGTLPENRKVKQVTAHVDILPTLIDLCGLQPGETPEFDGISLVPTLQNANERLPDRVLFVHLQPDQPVKWHHCVAMTDRWRLVNGEELYDMSSAPDQQDDIADQNPHLVVQLRAAYEDWWDSLQPAFADYVHIPIGTAEENPTVLTARDWHPTDGRIPWMQSWIADPAYDANGFWAIEVTQPGRYEICLRRYPTEADLPIDATEARVKFADIDETKRIQPDDPDACFIVNLEMGKTTLQTWFTRANSESVHGAYYVYTRRMD